MDKSREQDIQRFAVGLANGLLQLVGAGIVPRTAILDVANRDYIAAGIEAALREVVDTLPD